MDKWGLYNESYKIAADSDLLVRYLYEADLKVYYLNKYIVKMRMGGLSTDAGKSKLKWPGSEIPEAEEESLIQPDAANKKE